MINILYTLIIFPIEQIIEICFFYGQTWFRSHGVAIIGVSAAVSTLVLPVYLMAEKQQQKQREIEKGLKKGVDLIKSAFKGDERFMLLSTYYRQNNYRPIFALRNSIDLLIQIPFFIAAYHFLSNLEVLKGAQFWFVNDLGSPDGLLFGLNFLPVFMTVINLVSGMIYAKDLSAKDKAQLYLIPGVFLVLLYNSPAGLVLYWTCNNIYNLIKNIIVNVLKNKEQNLKTESKAIKDNALNDNRTFVLALTALTLLIGLVIPSGVISTGIEEFSYSVTGEHISPLRFVIYTMLQAGGFLLWGIILFFLFQRKARAVLTAAAVSLFIMSVMCTFVYWKNYGFLTQELVLSNYAWPTSKMKNSSFAVILALMAAGYFFIRIRPKQIIISLLFIAVLSFAAYGTVNVIKINTEFAHVKGQGSTADNEGDSAGVDKFFNFSRYGKNVIILMLDRAQGQHIPYIFEEKPELQKSFDGFIYYPNTVSFGAHTLYSAPSLFGGYYYAPYEIQKLRNQPLKEKHDEGIQVLPRIMALNHFDVTAANLPFIDESEAFAKKTFSDIDNIEAADIIDKYIDRYYRGRLLVNDNVRAGDYAPTVRKNLFQFALFKCSPYMIRSEVYNNGNYMNVDGVGVKNFASRTMLKNYISLLKYPEMTQIRDDDKNNLAIAVNCLVHSPSFLQYPDYKLVPAVTNRGSSIFANDPHYHVTALAFRLVSNWLNYLRENGIWDNTRIIMISDHGIGNDYNPVHGNFILPEGSKMQRFNALLMVKDFEAKGELKADSAFMTTADLTGITVKDIIENPVNPFTQKSIYTDKENGVIIPTTVWVPWSRHGEYTYAINDDEWLKVKENVFNKENWAKYSPQK